MSALYDSLSGDGRARQQTRCAHRETSAAARSWEGSITVSIHRESDGHLQAEIAVADGSQHGGRALWSGPLADIIKAKSLIVVPPGFVAFGIDTEKEAGDASL